MLDTSTVILLGRISDPAALPDEAVISAITLAELSVGPHVARTDRERVARQAHLQQAESDFDVLAFDAESARAFGAVAASLRASGRKPAARACDALIAASAIAYGLSAAVQLQANRLRCPRIRSVWHGWPASQSTSHSREEVLAQCFSPRHCERQSLPGGRCRTPHRGECCRRRRGCLLPAVRFRLTPEIPRRFHCRMKDVRASLDSSADG
jgi:tRNA(fMet)-specific endonuclease VapC